MQMVHTFSAFWLRSSVVSVLISLISDTLTSDIDYCIFVPELLAHCLHGCFSNGTPVLQYFRLFWQTHNFKYEILKREISCTTNEILIEIGIVKKHFDVMCR